MDDKINKTNVNEALPSLKEKMWQVKDHTMCEECSEELFFEMKDNYHEFSLSLSVVLNCLFIAEKEGYVPQLPDTWWSQIRQMK